MAESPSELQLEIEKLERKHTESPEGRYFVPLANAYRKMGEVEHAEHLLREGLKYHPDYLSAHIVLGRCLADRQELDAAATEFRHVLSVDAQNLVALRSLGEIATAAGQPDEAERWYRQLLEVDPMNDDARRALEEESGTQGQVDSGDSGPPQHYEMEEPMDLDEVLDLSGTSPETGATSEADELVTETIADLYAKQGFYDRAASVYRELIRRNGSTPELQENLAAVERQASEEAADDEPIEAEMQPEPSDADPFADSFATGFGGDIDPSERALVEDEPAKAETHSIADYLSELISWEPGVSSRSDMDLADTEASGEFGRMVEFGDEVEESIPSPASPEPSTTPIAMDDEEGSEEDDLESFQAWLRSLKR